MPGPMRKINRTRSVARGNPYGAKRPAFNPAPTLADRVKASPKAGASRKAGSVAGKVKASPKGRAGMKRKPGPAAITNRKQRY